MELENQREFQEAIERIEKKLSLVELELKAILEKLESIVEPDYEAL